MSHDEELEFELLGQKLRFKTDKNSEIDPRDIINHVAEEARKISTENMNLDRLQLAILTALKITSDKMTLEKDFKGNIRVLQSSAKDALDLIEQVRPMS